MTSPFYDSLRCPNCADKGRKFRGDAQRSRRRALSTRQIRDVDSCVNGRLSTTAADRRRCLGLPSSWRPAVSPSCSDSSCGRSRCGAARRGSRRVRNPYQGMRLHRTGSVPGVSRDGTSTARGVMSRLRVSRSARLPSRARNQCQCGSGTRGTSHLSSGAGAETHSVRDVDCRTFRYRQRTSRTRLKLLDEPRMRANSASVAGGRLCTSNLLSLSFSNARRVSISF